MTGALVCWNQRLKLLLGGTQHCSLAAALVTRSWEEGSQAPAALPRQPGRLGIWGWINLNWDQGEACQ